MASIISPIFGEARTQIGQGPSAVVIDVLDGETFTTTSVVTEHAVEDGSTISDHVQDKPSTLQLVAFFGQSLTDTLEQIEASLTRAEDLYQKLLELQAAKQRISVFTPRREHTGMMIERVTRPRTRSDGDGVQVTIDLKQVETATSEVVAAPPSRSQKNAKRNQGKKPKQPANESQQTSAAAKIFDWLGG